MHSDLMVTAINTISGVDNMPIVTFGEDEDGEVYFTIAFGRIYGLVQESKQ